MKNNKGISLIKIVIITSIIVIVICIIAGIIIGLNGKGKQQEIQNTEVIQNEEKNNIINNDVVQTEIKKDVKELEFTETFLLDGKTKGNVEVLNNRIDNTLVLSITGVSESNINEADSIEGKNRWYKTIDLTNYNTLEFYARNAKDNGDIMIFIDSRMIEKVRYTNVPSIWTKYQVDVSKYSGKHELSIAGGYADSAGSEESNTQYRNIKLK